MPWNGRSHPLTGVFQPCATVAVALLLVLFPVLPCQAVESFTSPNPKVPDAIPYRRSIGKPTRTPSARTGGHAGSPEATPSPPIEHGADEDAGSDGHGDPR